MGIQAILANKIAHNEQSQNLRLAMAADEFPYLLKGPLDEEGEHLRIALRIAEPLYCFCSFIVSINIQDFLLKLIAQPQLQIVATVFGVLREFILHSQAVEGLGEGKSV